MPPCTAKIVLLEDEDEVRRLVGEVLRLSGYQVTEFGDGQQALRACEEKRLGAVDLLVSDVVMPGMGGCELAQRMQLALPRMKLLFMSGYPRHSLPKSNTPPSEADFLQKPF